VPGITGKKLPLFAYRLAAERGEPIDALQRVSCGAAAIRSPTVTADQERATAHRLFHNKPVGASNSTLKSDRPKL
jgi:hypothetical protein